MAETTKSRWDIGRLWQTLTYFEVIPFISCLQRIFTGDKHKTANGKQISMETILVVGVDSEIGKQVTNYLLDHHYPVKVLAKDADVVKEAVANGVEFLTADTNTITAQALTGVKAIICCGEVDNQTISNLVQAAVESIQPATDKLLFDFTNPTTAVKDTWGAVDDVVMGGVSQSNMRVQQNCAVFAGIVSTDNNGGFASVRTRNFQPPLNLSDYEGIELRVKGDGKRYKFIIRCEGKWDGIGYCYSFDTVYDFWTTIRVSFQELIPVFRAKTVPEAGDFDSSKVYSMQLMLSKFEYDGALNQKFEPGSFALEVEYIKAYGSEPKPQLILVAPETGDRKEILQTSGLAYKIINPEAGMNSEAIAQTCLQFL